MNTLPANWGQTPVPILIFVLTAIFLNLITLGINSAMAASNGGATQTIGMVTFVALIIIVNVVAEID